MLFKSVAGKAVNFKGVIIRFDNNGEFNTTDKEVAEALNKAKGVEEVKAKPKTKAKD